MRVHGRGHGSFVKGLCNVCFCGGNMEPMMWYDMLFERNRCHSECIHSTRIPSCPLLLFGRFLTSQQAILVNFWRLSRTCPPKRGSEKSWSGLCPDIRPRGAVKGLQVISSFHQFKWWQHEHFFPAIRVFSMMNGLLSCFDKNANEMFWGHFSI